MQYARLASHLERLEATSGRLEMTGILVELLAEAKPREVTPIVRLLQGAVAPDWEGLEVGLAEKQILKVLVAITGGSSKSEDAIAKMEARYHELGDLGKTAESVVAGSQGRQASLVAAEALDVVAVFHALQAMARTSGTGSQEQKQGQLRALLQASTPIEARYIVRTVAGRLRLGVADMTFLDALANHHLGRGVRSVTDMDDAQRAEHESVRGRLERALDVRSDLAVVAEALAQGGMAAVDALDVALGTPLRPMAAERLKTLPEILAKMNGRVGMEYKYDGLRIQAHVPADPTRPVRLFSRRLEDLTAQFPDVCANLRTHFHGRDAVVEGEAVALDEHGRLRPFQEISRRRGRKTDLERMAQEIPITMFLFDCLAEGGHAVLDESQADRRARLARMVGVGEGPIRMSTWAEATTAEAMEHFFDQAVADGAEGIMCKDPAATYKAGARGFAWVKFKTDYTAALVDTMDLVVIGAFYGRGRRAGWYGALLMAAYDKEADVWPSVCKLGTGFDDATLSSLKDRFAPFVAPARPRRIDSEMEPDVWFEPHTVMEVQAAELTLSPIHRAAWGRLKPGAGLAARFPRFTGRWREDKSAKDATTVDELVAMHQV